jgi:aryl-alcohol dehydrogenase-like predicted oxidoreductase
VRSEKIEKSKNRRKGSFSYRLRYSNMGDNVVKFEQEVEGIRVGHENGVQVIDTAEMYGDGNAEKLIAHAVKAYNRENLFLISKIPQMLT